MLRILTGTASLFLLSTFAFQADASYRPIGTPQARQSADLVQLALNPQPEPPNIPQKGDGTTSAKKGTGKAMKPSKKGDPRH